MEFRYLYVVAMKGNWIGSPARDGVFGGKRPSLQDAGLPGPVRHRGEFGTTFGRTASDARLRSQGVDDRPDRVVHRAKEEVLDKGVGSGSNRVMVPHRLGATPGQHMQRTALMHRKSQQANPDQGGLSWPRTRN
jgi:hypothetical protein